MQLLPAVNLDRANVDRLRYLTRFKEVSAPYDGVITERRIDIGDLVRRRQYQYHAAVRHCAISTAFGFSPTFRKVPGSI
jgi:multidrug resistance efflux pump